MSHLSPTDRWLADNQDLLVAEFNVLRQRLKGENPSKALDAVEAARKKMPRCPAVDDLAETFRLSDFERQLLLLCAGVELDAEIAAICSGPGGPANRTYATFGLALASLTDGHWTALTPTFPLRRYRLITVQDGHRLTTAPLAIEERILHFLVGLNFLEPKLESLLTEARPAASMAEEHQAVADAVSRALVAEAIAPPVIQFCGDDPLGQEDVASKIAKEHDRRLYVVRSEDLPAIGPDLESFAALWTRESLLLPGELFIQCSEEGLTSAGRRLAERLPGTVYIGASNAVYLNRPFLRFDIDKPAPLEQRRLWIEALGPNAAKLEPAVEALSEQYRLSAQTIGTTGRLAACEEDLPSTEQLWNACRSLARPRMEDLAERIEPRATWDDLVLPEAQMTVLRALADQVRNRMTVYEKWGFSAKGRRGLGVSGLFSGESGTGKTLAAEAIAHELGLDLYRIDLSSVVSKYIGETEKNLKRVFDAAEGGGAVLLFDEADALFGKRGEVKDSHDRYANIEVGYLLQRMEAFQGLAILTTNMKSSMDKAFQRRLRFSVSFPFPDAGQRQAIWSRVFPDQTPTEGLETAKLSQLNVAGGSIKNIALNAAFAAAAADKAVTMAYVLDAARLEAEKIERQLAPAETRGWV